jgi:hypothetical protein
MTRALPAAAAWEETSWVVTEDGGDDGFVASPHLGGADGSVPIISEINEFDSDFPGCSYVEITCPGGPAFEFCSYTVGLGCEEYETCLHSIPGPSSVGVDALDCAAAAADCQEFNTNCWAYIFG